LSASDFVQINCYNNFSVATLPTSGLTGTISNAQLQNSSITINGSAVSLGGSVSLPGDIESVTASSPLTGGGTSGAVTIGIQSASTSQSGAVQLIDSTSSTSTSTAATPNSVKSAYDLANGAIQKTLTTTTGDIIYASGANTPARLGIGSTGNVLTVAGGVPTWSAPAGGGKILQVVSSASSGDSSTTSTSFVDTGLTCNITPSSSNSKILVLLSQIFSADKVPNANMVPSQQLLRGSTTIASSSVGRFYYVSAGQIVLVYQVQYTILDTPATTSQLTYKTQHKVNGSDMTSTATGTSTITLLEVGA
jgi:hypothetical protein